MLLKLKHMRIFVEKLSHGLSQLFWFESRWRGV